MNYEDKIIMGLLRQNTVWKQAVFSYETALYLQGLTDKIPQVMDVTVPASYKINEVPLTIELYYAKSELATIE